MERPFCYSMGLSALVAFMSLILDYGYRIPSVSWHTPPRGTSMSLRTTKQSVGKFV